MERHEIKSLVNQVYDRLREKLIEELSAENVSDELREKIKHALLGAAQDCRHETAAELLSSDGPS